MPKLIVKTETVEDGEYPLDMTYGNFTMDEFETMSRVSGAYGLEILDRFWKDDGPAIVAVAVVMMQRAGRSPDVATLKSAKRSSFTFDFTDLAADGDGGPPAEAPPSGSDSPGGSSDEAESSG